MSEQVHRGRVTIPTDVDVVPETLEILKRWGADAIRDCDGTNYPEALKGVDAKVYSTYYTTRKDNAWDRSHPEEVQQCYIMTGFYTAAAGALSIPLMRGISPELCVEEAMRGMLHHKTIIVPSAIMRAATTAQRFMPMAILMPIMAHQQKKKLG